MENYSEENEKMFDRRMQNANEAPFFQVMQNPMLLQYITSFQNGRKWDQCTEANWVVKCGFFSLLKEKKRLSKLRIDRDLQYTITTLDHAIGFEYFDIVQWLLDNGNKNHIGKGVDILLEKGDLKKIKWCYEKKLYCSTNGFYHACKSADIFIMKWILDHHSEIFKNAIDIVFEIYNNTKKIHKKEEYIKCVDWVVSKWNIYKLNPPKYYTFKRLIENNDFEELSKLIKEFNEDISAEKLLDIAKKTTNCNLSFMLIFLEKQFSKK